MCPDFQLCSEAPGLKASAINFLWQEALPDSSLSLRRGSQGQQRVYVSQTNKSVDSNLIKAFFYQLFIITGSNSACLEFVLQIYTMI